MGQKIDNIEDAILSANKAIEGSVKFDINTNL